jgi:ketosteroid isomerase-like protein
MAPAMKHPNVEIAERAWQAVAEADIETLETLWPATIVWHVTTDNPWRGDHVGRDAVLDYLAEVGEAGEAYEASIEDILVSDDRVLIVSRVSARRGDRRLDTQQCLLARIEDGAIAEVWTLALDPSAYLGFWKEATRKAG